MGADQVISALLGSEVRGDLLVLFHRNPGLIDSIEGIARRIGRSPGTIQSDVRELVHLGVLKEKKIGRTEVIFLDREKDRELLESVADHIRSSGVAGQI
jgi:predicted transcriptional regulator